MTVHECHVSSTSMFHEDHLWPSSSLKDDVAGYKSLGPHLTVGRAKLNVALEMYHTRFISFFMPAQLIILKHLLKS